MATYSVSLTTNATTFITSVDSDNPEVEEYELAMLAVSRIADEEGLDLTHRRWEVMVEKL